uniref:Uncharacterized protein n=1 Tax=Streptococcus agalactiae TaxID=1311 RepID=A0A2Z5WBA2_STRAG|nr:unnamed protein product [Streptococcus agalactiae]
MSKDFVFNLRLAKASLFVFVDKVCYNITCTTIFSVMDITQDSGSWDRGSIPLRWIIDAP